MRTSNHHPDHLQLNPNPTLLARAANPTHVRSGVEKGVKNHRLNSLERSRAESPDLARHLILTRHEVLTEQWRFSARRPSPQRRTGDGTPLSPTGEEGIGRGVWLGYGTKRWKGSMGQLGNFPCPLACLERRTGLTHSERVNPRRSSHVAFNRGSCQ